MAVLCCWSSKALVAGDVIVGIILVFFVFTREDWLDRFVVIAGRKFMTTLPFLRFLSLSSSCRESAACSARGRNNSWMKRIEHNRGQRHQVAY